MRYCVTCVPSCDVHNMVGDVPPTGGTYSIESLAPLSPLYVSWTGGVIDYRQMIIILLLRAAWREYVYPERVVSWLVDLSHTVLYYLTIILSEHHFLMSFYFFFLFLISLTPLTQIHLPHIQSRYEQIQFVIFFIPFYLCFTFVAFPLVVVY